MFSAVVNGLAQVPGVRGVAADAGVEPGRSQGRLG
jgi:hypothetical protein